VMSEPVEWTMHPSLAARLASRRKGDAMPVEPVAPALEVGTLAVLGFIPLVGGVTTTFVPPGGHMGAPAGSPLPASPTSESVLLFEPPVTESLMVPFRPSSGPLEWPSSGDAGATWFVLDDSREEKLWRHAGRQGLEAQETLAAAKGHVALLLEEIERAERLVASGLPPVIGVSVLPDGATS